MKYYNPLSVFFFAILILVLIYGCQRQPDYEVKNFNPAINVQFPENDTATLDVHIQENIFEGIKIPDKGFFRFSFDIKNNKKAPQQYYYKIFYRNESYKYAESIGFGDTVQYNPLASENFYGSWSPVSDSFHLIAEIQSGRNWVTIVDSFQIVGNPRDESTYFGKTEDEVYPDENRIEKVKQTIKGSPEWMEAIKAKAIDQKRSLNEQIFLDALWVLRHERDDGDANNRWKRNSRAGTYSFVLMVVKAENINKVPYHIKHLDKMAGDTLFQDPYYFLFHDPLRLQGDMLIQKADKHIKTRVVFDLDRGIYFDPLKYTNPELDKTYLGVDCDFSKSLYKRAQVQQFFHNIDKNFIMENIPEVRNLNEVTQEDYNSFVQKYSSEQMIQDHIRNSESPCKTIEYSDEAEAILLKNSASTPKEKRKENVGIQSRVGFTYGKISAKIQFPKMLNQYNVWNGITNAFWLIYHEEGDWNHRRTCEETGYIPKGEIGETDVRIPSTFYTEIDIEIVKASKHWPESSYYNDVVFPANDSDKEDDIIVTCTNWDLACNEPDSFSVGLFKVKHEDKMFYPHRWDHWYKALTMKYGINHGSIFDRDYYYYQIDWQPDCIIWRIGPEMDQLFEIGYLDTTVSSIPNNQMTFIVTQEYHHSEWWPTTTFQQQYIPYPANELVGKVFEVTIE
ncbi:MAG: hypothetical protein R2750_05900 [Bacteroidales bacterium]